MREYHIVWKAFRRRHGKLCFLFRGHFGSLVVPLDTWMTSTENLVRDGRGRRYKAGFHFIRDLKTLHKFNRLTKGKYFFKKVLVRGIRPKPGSRTGVWLARELHVSSAYRARKHKVVEPR